MNHQKNVLKKKEEISSVKINARNTFFEEIEEKNVGE